MSLEKLAAYVEAELRKEGGLAEGQRLTKEAILPWLAGRAIHGVGAAVRGLGKGLGAIGGGLAGGAKATGGFFQRMGRQFRAGAMGATRAEAKQFAGGRGIARLDVLPTGKRLAPSPVGPIRAPKAPAPAPISPIEAAKKLRGSAAPAAPAAPKKKGRSKKTREQADTGGGAAGLAMTAPVMMGGGEPKQSSEETMNDVLEKIAEILPDASPEEKVAALAMVAIEAGFYDYLAQAAQGGEKTASEGDGLVRSGLHIQQILAHLTSQYGRVEPPAEKEAEEPKGQEKKASDLPHLAKFAKMLEGEIARPT